MASNDDEMLLESGHLSDITVKCGDQEWALHSNILRERCPFFEWVLRSVGFEESTGGMLELPDQDPDKVYWAIYFIYTGKATSDLAQQLRGDKTAIKCSFALFVIADFFGLDSLCKYAAAAAEKNISNHAVKLRDSLRFDTGELRLQQLQEFDDKHFLDSFLEVAKVVYTHYGVATFRPFKDALLSYVKYTGNIAIRDKLLGRQLFTDPELADFAKDILKMIGSISINKEIGGYCIVCGTALSILAPYPADLCESCKPPASRDVEQFLGESEAEELVPTLSDIFSGSGPSAIYPEIGE